MEDLNKEERSRICELTEFALAPIRGTVVSIGSLSVVKMISQIGDAPPVESDREVFTVSVRSSVGEDHLLLSVQHGIWNGVRNMCQDLAYSNKVRKSERDEIIGILWSEEFSAKNI